MKFNAGKWAKSGISLAMLSAILWGTPLYPDDFYEQAEHFWKQLGKEFGEVPGSTMPKIIVSREAFFEVPRGNTMQAVYLPHRNTVLLRKKEPIAARHELVHAYLSWRNIHLSEVQEENVTIILSAPVVSCGKAAPAEIPPYRMPYSEVTCGHFVTVRQLLLETSKN